MLLYVKNRAGGHFREETQTEDGEAKRRTEIPVCFSAWEYKERTFPDDAIGIHRRIGFTKIFEVKRKKVTNSCMVAKLLF